MSKSIYLPTDYNELKRLNTQADNSYKNDKSIINKAVSKIKKEKINILDVGCGYGFVSLSRFGALKKVENIICLDTNRQCIKFGKENIKDERFYFNLFNLEEDNYSEIEKILKEKIIKKFDIIFASLLIHHLSDPISVLKKLKHFLSDTGCIIIKGSDDGSKIGYPDETGLIKKIIKQTSKIKGCSDRYNGRKIYNQLYNSGYKNIETFSLCRDTSGTNLSDKLKIYEDSFSYRINYLEKDFDKNNCKDKQIILTKFKKDLDNIRNLFTREDFWYCEYDYYGIGYNS